MRPGPVLLLAGLCLAGCGGSDRPPLSTGSGPTPPTGTQVSPTAAPQPAAPGADLVTVTAEPPADPAQARVFADYVAFWQRDQLALRTNDLAGSGLLDHLFPPQRERTVGYLAQARRAGRHTEGVIGIGPQVGSVRGSGAVVRDCLDQAGSYDVDRAGRRLPRTGPARLRLTVTLQRGTDGRWKVSNLARENGSC